jgi:adenylate kinase family enzyme
MRVVILGNAGSGKTTLARWLAERARAERLDLDTVAWEPGQSAVPREPALAQAEVGDFCRSHERWMVEGYYASLVRTALAFHPRLIWLDPGIEVCLANRRSRPWEPHKYASAAEQNERLPFLLEWVAGYDERTRELGRAEHRQCFLSYDEPLMHRVAMPRLGALAEMPWS